MTMYTRTLLLFVLLSVGLVHAARSDEARFDVAVANAPARPFFEGLADGTPYNIVLEPGVGGSITVAARSGVIDGAG